MLRKDKKINLTSIDRRRIDRVKLSRHTTSSHDLRLRHVRRFWADDLSDRHCQALNALLRAIGLVFPLALHQIGGSPHFVEFREKLRFVEQKAEGGLDVQRQNGVHELSSLVRRVALGVVDKVHFLIGF